MIIPLRGQKSGFGACWGIQPQKGHSGIKPKKLLQEIMRCFRIGSSKGGEIRNTKTLNLSRNMSKFVA